tara:strand:+ start:727 stop:891 length:165 start_codon:yes stop_codon:yes gene_type:complete
VVLGWMKQTLFEDQINSFEFNCVEALIWFLLHNIGERNYEEFGNGCFWACARGV